jgi:antitoxin component of MazEF toxin-antitoxin module
VTKLIEVSHTRKRGASVGMNIPRKVVEKLGIEDGRIVRFYEEERNIIIR